MASTPTSQITRNLIPANIATATSTGARVSISSYLVQGATDIIARLEKEEVLTNHQGNTWGN